MAMPDNKRIGVALSGGGARGIAHIGVLQALEENGISPQFVSGSSAGSIVGALYAAGKSPQEILQIFKNTPLYKLFKLTMPTAGLTDLSNLKLILAQHIEKDSFEGLERQFFVCVTNLTKGRFEICSKGELFEWIAASCTIPIVFSAREINGSSYVDGGLLNNLPIEPLEESKCDLIVGVNVTPIDSSGELDNMLTIGSRTFDMALWANVQPRLERCHVTIEPKTDDFGLFSTSQTDEIFQAGYDAAIRQIPNILKALAQGEPVNKPLRPNLPNIPFNIPTPNLGKIVKRTRIMTFGTQRKENVSSPASLVHLPPATLFYVGRRRNGTAVFSLIQYDEKELTEKGSLEESEIERIINSEQVSWLNIDGVHDTESIEFISKRFGLHPLTAEDIVHTQQRSAVEVYENYLFISLKMLSLDPQDERIDIEQVSLVLGGHFVLSFQEKSEDVLEPLRDRLRKAVGRVRRRKSDYLFYSIMDLIVSNYAVVMEELDERIEQLEIKMDKEDNKKLLEEVQELKKGLAYLRNAISPLRLAVDELIETEHALIAEETWPYFKDLSAQIEQVIEQMETQRTVLDSLREQYISMSSYRSNEIMKVLTIIASIFIPLTFIAGIYGMNFDNIPELHTKNGYFVVWGVMLTVMMGMLYFFRRKKWL